MSSASTAAATLRRYADLPGPRGIPILGNALQVNPNQMHLLLERWAEEYGPAFKFTVGKRRLMAIGDHDQIATVLRDRPEGFARSERFAEIWAELGFPGGVFGANGEVWKRQRRMVMSSFDPGHVKSYYPALTEVADALTVRWRKAAVAGATIPLQADLMRFTVDTIAGLAFGSKVDTLSSDGDVIQHHLDKIFPALTRRLYAPIPWWRIKKSAADRELEAGLKVVMRAVQRFVAEARARLVAEPGRRSHPHNLLEAMIAAADQPDSGIDDDQVVGNVLTMLLAGEDTTANTLAWMIHLLWRHPQALARATAEVRRAVPAGAMPTLEQLSTLDYVEACAHETMRLKPVAPLLPLQALQDARIGDVEVPKGVVVFSLMRRDSVDARHVEGGPAFDPARWLGAQGGPLKRLSMPFGAGPRMCPGRYLALLEMKMAMAILLGRFDITGVDTPDGQAAREWLSFTMGPLGLTMRLAERNA